MTREEAVKIMSQIWGGSPQHDLADSYVDAFLALGMLKLEDPPSVTLWSILRNRGVSIDTAQWICNDALNVGLLSPKSRAVGSPVLTHEKSGS